jgi:hypothetical protein
MYYVQDSRTGVKNTWVFNTEAHPLRVAGPPQQKQSSELEIRPIDSTALILAPLVRCYDMLCTMLLPSPSRIMRTAEMVAGTSERITQPSAERSVGRRVGNLAGS